MHNTFRALCHIYSSFKFATYHLRSSGGKSISGAKIDRRRLTIVRRTPSVSLHACQGLRQRLPFFPERCLSLSLSLSFVLSLCLDLCLFLSCSLHSSIIHVRCKYTCSTGQRPVSLSAVNSSLHVHRDFSLSPLHRLDTLS